MVLRPNSVQQLAAFRDTRLIKIVSGVRRSGKSTLLELYRMHLLEKGVHPRQIIEINLEDAEFRHLLDPWALHDYIKARLLPQKMNYVFLELRRRGYEVSFGKVDNMELDFVAVKEGNPVYFQVALTTREKSTLERELRPLNIIKDHYRKYLLTLDEDPPASYNGIQRINALDWLLDDKNA